MTNDPATSVRIAQKIPYPSSVWERRIDSPGATQWWQGKKAGKEERSPSRRRRAPGPAIPGIDPIKSDDSHLYLPVFATPIILGERAASVSEDFMKFYYVQSCRGKSLGWQLMTKSSWTLAEG